MNAIFLPNPPALGSRAVNNITPTGTRLTAVVNPLGFPTTIYFGLPNLVRFAFGLDPANPDRSLIPVPQITGNNFVLSVTQPSGVSGVTYGAQYTTSLDSTNWQPIPDSFSGGVHTFSVPIGANPQIFLRLTVSNPCAIWQQTGNAGNKETVVICLRL